MKELVDTLFTKKRSITQRIEHSLVWRSEFSRYVQDIDDKIGKNIKNVKAAKHRHESQAKPRGRFVLYMDAFVTVATHMMADRDSDIRHDAADFLEYLTEEVALQAAMLADATDEGLYFTRVVDDEDTDMASLQATVLRFIRKLEVLFKDGQCVDLPGYTHFMIESLKRVRVIRLSRTEVRSLGGDGKPSQAVVQRCLQRMQRFVKLAVAVTVAEFPDYELCSSFRVFELQQSLRSKTCTLHEEHRTCLERLAKFFGLDRARLEAQYIDRYPQALRALQSSPGMTNTLAWRRACAEQHNGRSLANHPCKELLEVVMRYTVYAVSTAKIEQNFSVYKRTFGEQGLNGSEVMEERMAKLVLTPKSEEIIKRAQAFSGES